MERARLTARATLYQLAVRAWQRTDGVPNDKLRAALRAVGLDPDLQVEGEQPLLGLIRAAIPAWNEGDLIDVNRGVIAETVVRTLGGGGGVVVEVEPPSEPTDEMVVAGDEAIIETLQEHPRDVTFSKGTPAERCYRAMVRAWLSSRS